MQMLISNNLTLSEIPDEKVQIIKKTLTLSNPMFFKLKRMGKWVGHTPSSFKYYSIENDTITIPRGMVERIKKFLPGIECEYNVVDIKNDLTTFFPDIKLRDYQQPIIDHWRKSGKQEGVFNLGTGTGKTIIALQIMKELGLTSTILVPNNIILDQFVSEAKLHWGYDLGVINGNKKEIKEVTVACVASLFDNEELLNELIKNTSVLFVDECSSFISEKRVEILSRFNPKYLYGCTGTPDREDGQTKAIFFYFGDIIEEYTPTAIDPIVEVIDSRTFIPVKVNYNEMVDLQITNLSRNTLISGIALGEILNGRKVLILTKRIEHYQEIMNKLPKSDNILVADSSDRDLGDKLDELRREKKDFSCIIGTFSLLGTGFNIEKLDTLIIAGDLKSSILTTQSAGRVLRLLKDKTAKIIDIWDKDNGIFNRQFDHRKQLYNKKGWKIVMPWDDKKDLFTNEKQYGEQRSRPNVSHESIPAESKAKAPVFGEKLCSRVQVPKKRKV